jgi:hypothetical protein
LGPSTWSSKQKQQDDDGHQAAAADKGEGDNQERMNIGGLTFVFFVVGAKM